MIFISETSRTAAHLVWPIVTICSLIFIWYCFVLCSGGVGRTGAFITVHTQLERLKTEGVVDVFQSLKSARIQRAGLVDTLVSSAMIVLYVYTVEPPIKDAPNKGHDSEHQKVTFQLC